MTFTVLPYVGHVPNHRTNYKDKKIKIKHVNFLTKKFVSILDSNTLSVHVTDDDGSIAFHYSARCGSFELFRYFADMGVDINIKNNDGWNCLHVAALYGHLNLCKILIDKHKFDMHMTENDG